MVTNTVHEARIRMVKVGFAQLHGDLFVNGRALAKGGVHHILDPQHIAGLSMVYDTVEKELIVTYNGVTAHVPSTNVASYIPGTAPDRKIIQTTSPQVANIGHAQVETPSTRVQNPQPQVETPMSHVHKGKGHGKTGQTK